MLHSCKLNLQSLQIDELHKKPYNQLMHKINISVKASLGILNMWLMDLIE